MAIKISRQIYEQCINNLTTIFLSLSFIVNACWVWILDYFIVELLSQLQIYYKLNRN